MYRKRISISYDANISFMTIFPRKKKREGTISKTCLHDEIEGNFAKKQADNLYRNYDVIVDLQLILLSSYNIAQKSLLPVSSQKKGT